MTGSPAPVEQPLFPCFVKDCPWEASLQDGMWLCERHSEATFVYDDEARIIWPKIGEMDRRIREATERIIRRLHQEPDAFAMFMALTEVAIGIEEKVKKLPEAGPIKGRGGIEV